MNPVTTCYDQGIKKEYFVAFYSFITFSFYVVADKNNEIIVAIV